MKTVRIYKVTVAIFIFCAINFISSDLAYGAEHGEIEIETQHIKYVIGQDGSNLGFIDKKSGTDYLAKERAVKFAKVTKGGKEYEATAASFADGKITVKFGQSGVTAVLEAVKQKRYFTLKVLSVSDKDIEKLTFIDIAIKTNGTVEDNFPGCALALNIQTQIDQLPGSNNILRAMCYPRFGFAGSQVAIIGCPKDELRDIMKEVVEAADELPKAKLCGPWAKEGQINKGSYIFNFSDLTLENIDEWITTAKELGMNQIDFHGGESFTWGDYQLNKKWYPNGWDDMKAIVAKLHKAGIAAGLHTYTFFVDKRSKWVTPVPDKRLGKDVTFTLTSDLTAEANTVFVDESTEKMSPVTGYATRNSATLHIDDELITYTGVKKDAPYAFTGCKRGDCGTKVTAHAKGAKAAHLLECFFTFAPDGDSTLLTEVAEETAKMYNYCDFDMIYFDAIDAADIFAGPEYAWYYGPKYAFEVAKRIKKHALIDLSNFYHNLWYVRSRLIAWDHSNRGHKKFVDEHCNAYRYNYANTFLPAFLGWGAVVIEPTSQEETTFPDDIEYLCCKCIGYDAGQAIVSLNPGGGMKGITPAVFKEYSYVQRAGALIKQYETLRYANYFSESIKQKLKVLGDEFTLEQGEKGQWQLRPVQYSKHKAIDIDDSTKTWKMKNKFAGQPLKMRIEALWAAGAYDAAGNFMLADFNEPEKNFTQRLTAPGVSAKLEASTDQVKVGKVSGYYSAANSGTKINGAWSGLEKKFVTPPPINGLKGMGVWIYGDGKGEVLNIKLNAAADFIGGAGDHYVIIDFKGWKYVELIEPEGDRFDDYIWPQLSHTAFSPYAVYRFPVNYTVVDTLGLWYNNIPAGGEVKCYLSPIKAMPIVESTVKNPAITIDGKTITFPVEIKSGGYLEFKSLSDCKLYNAKGEFVSDVKPQGDVPELTAGENSVTFNSTAESGARARAYLTLISQDEKPLTK